ncbi:uncharacterized protein MELLADRAFT_111281 [Melampsora larici-populina 98AG31]|uniref:Uncharacterized protein n=1 Tax=Melampsora larici-populina (strain 98AG31 / pathotype 3-4-7) TaxID=747676 RepID=F4S2M0_MELLP|nr:uncharacterized protein MELLADRAFT_111281 [Melampsora larici-populina 98AG31]EGG01107.1 hypothetical protein MELLADRAFT_111281 [Melampsora larici-populina 98AG31]
MHTEHSIASQRMLNGANFIYSPSYPKSEVGGNRCATPAESSGSNFTSTNAFDTHSNIQASGDQTHQNHLADAQPISNKRNSILQKVVQGARWSKGAVARPVSIQAGTATPQPLHGMKLYA